MPLSSAPFSQIKLKHLSKELLDKASPQPSFIPPEPLRKAEAQAILQVLEKHGGNRERTAEELGISGVTLWRKMKKLGL